MKKVLKNKFFKPVIVAVLALLMILSALPFSPVKTYALGTLSGISFSDNGNTISFNAYPGAAAYKVHYNNNQGSTSTTSTTIDLREVYKKSVAQYGPGTYKTSINAVDSNNNEISERYEFDYYYDAYGMTKLDKPTNLKIEKVGSVWRFSCDPVAHAEKYYFEARLGGYNQVWSTYSNTTYVDVGQEDWPCFSDENDYELGVYAKADGYIQGDFARKTFKGWYSLPYMTLHLNGDMLAWDNIDGAKMYKINVKNYGGILGVNEKPVDLREICTKKGYAAGTYEFSMRALDENHVELTKKTTVSYTYDGNPSTKYMVSFWNSLTNSYTVQMVNDGQCATEPAKPTAEGKKFLNWYKKDSSPNNAFDFSTPITKSTYLQSHWADEISYVEVTPSQAIAEGRTTSQCTGTVAEDAEYRIYTQYFISGNTGKQMTSSETFEGGCDYLWVVILSNRDKNTYAWADLDDIEVFYTGGYDLFRLYFDENGRLVVVYSFRTEGYSPLEIVEVSDVTIHVPADNPGGKTGKIYVKNTGQRNATVTPSINSTAQRYITLDTFGEYTLSPGQTKEYNVITKSTFSEPGHYIMDVKFRTGSSVEFFSTVTVIVEGEASHTMNITQILDRYENETDTVTIPLGYSSLPLYGFWIYMESDDDIEDLDMELSDDRFTVGQVLSDWHPRTFPFDYDGGDVLAISIYPKEGLEEGTYTLNVSFSGFEMYALSTQLNFIVSHVHEATKVPRQAPTCTNTGREAYWTCSECGKNFYDEDCTSEIASLTDISIPAIPHTFGEWNVITEPGHLSTGLRERYCTVCNYREDEVMPSIPCVVTFETFGHGTPSWTEEVYYGGTCYSPSTLEADGWIFLGWYSDPDFETPCKYSWSVYDDITIYARWAEDTAITLSPAKLTIPTLSAKAAAVEPNNGRELIWSSSNEAVATVDSNGLITAHTYGKATITCKTADGKWSATCTVNTLFNDVAGSPSSSSPDYQYYYKAVYWAADYKPAITKGMPGSVIFGVGLDCTRQDFILFLYRHAKQPTPDAETLANLDTIFSDVSTLSNTFRKAIAWGYYSGIIKGYSDGTFGVGATILRKDAMIMLYRYAGKPKPSSAGIAAAKEYTDCASLPTNSDTFKSIAWAAEKGITKGYSTSNPPPSTYEYPLPCFGNTLPCLREQMIVFLYRYNNLK